MTTTTNSRKPVSKLARFDIPFDMIVSRRRKLRGFGLDERRYYGLMA